MYNNLSINVEITLLPFKNMAVINLLVCTTLKVEGTIHYMLTMCTTSPYSKCIHKLAKLMKTNTCTIIHIFLNTHTLLVSKIVKSSLQMPKWNKERQYRPLLTLHSSIQQYGKKHSTLLSLISLTPNSTWYSP